MRPLVEALSTRSGHGVQVNTRLRPFGSSRAWRRASHGAPRAQELATQQRPGGVVLASGPEPSGRGTVRSRLERPPGSSGSSSDSGDDVSNSGEGEAAPAFNGQLLASLGALFGLAVLVGGTFLAKDYIAAFIQQFTELVDDWGALGYAAFILLYCFLEVLAVPALPLTVTAGAIFGIPLGTCAVSLGATAACTIAFLIARYLARDRVRDYAACHPKFAAIDRAIGRDGLKVVALLRLSPLLPLSASNYLYGLTSVPLRDYVLGSWLGMLPGTFAYVAFGTYGKQILTGEGGGPEGAGVEWWQVALALGVSAVAVAYIGRIAQQALSEIE